MLQTGTVLLINISIAGYQIQPSLSLALPVRPLYLLVCTVAADLNNPMKMCGSTEGTSRVPDFC